MHTGRKVEADATSLKCHRGIKQALRDLANPLTGIKFFAQQGKLEQFLKDHPGFPMPEQYYEEQGQTEKYKALTERIPHTMHRIEGLFRLLNKAIQDKTSYSEDRILSLCQILWKQLTGERHSWFRQHVRELRASRETNLSDESLFQGT